jgi:hypothetical protein
MPRTATKPRKIYKAMAFRPKALKALNVLASENNLSVQETVEKIILGEIVPSEQTFKTAETVELPQAIKATPETRFKNPETGEIYTVAAWCELLNITHKQFVGRLNWANRSGDFSGVFTPGSEEDLCFRYAELTHNGLTLTAEEWADRLEMSYNQFRDRYRRYKNLGRVENAFEPIDNFGAFKYQQLTCDNETLTAEEWAIKLEMPFENFRMRYNHFNNKGEADKAFTPPRKEYFGTEELTHNDITLTAEEWAIKLGMTYTQFRKRYWRFHALGQVEKAFNPIESQTKFADELLTHPKTGETLTIREWSKKLNQTVDQLYPKVRKFENDAENKYKIFEPLKREGKGSGRKSKK